MAASLLERAIRRDRLIVGAALAVLTALAWSYVLWLAAAMSGGMAGMRMIPSGLVPARAPWTGVEAAYVLAMWAAMMVGMMTPSAAPMILIHAQVGRQAAARGKAFAATGWFVTGYLAAWSLFAVVATAAQWALERGALLDPTTALASRRFGAAVLIAAGLYQWTPLKDRCLAQCQAPLLFIQRHGGLRRDPAGAALLGLRHGAYCVGCCWALMALLFVGGVMNVLWIAVIAAFVLVEKITPVGRLISRAAGLALAAAGVWLLALA